MQFSRPTTHDFPRHPQCIARRRGDDRRAITSVKHLSGGCAFRPGDGEEDRPNRLPRLRAARPGDPGGGDGDIGIANNTSTTRHRLYTGRAHDAITLDERGRHAQERDFHRRTIGNNAAT